jgi:hypothetical protein
MWCHFLFFTTMLKTWRMPIQEELGQVFTCLLTPWSKVLLEKPTGFAASQEIPHIYGTRKFITLLTSACHLSLSWARSVQSRYLRTVLLNGEGERLYPVSTTVIRLNVVNLTRWSAEWSFTSQEEYNGCSVISFSDTKENKMNKILDMEAGWKSHLGVPSIYAALWGGGGTWRVWWLLRW